MAETRANFSNPVSGAVAVAVDDGLLVTSAHEDPSSSGIPTVRSHDSDDASSHLTMRCLAHLHSTTYTEGVAFGR